MSLPPPSNPTPGPNDTPNASYPPDPTGSREEEYDAERLDEEIEALERGTMGGVGEGGLGVGLPSRSPYRLTSSERARGVANRIMFSRYYIFFYLIMTGLSLGTVVLSLMEGGCPSTTWHILEIIVNGGMVLEVGTRWVGFGKQYPLTPLNVLDLFLTAFCIITLLLVFLNPCGASSKRKSTPLPSPRLVSSPCRSLTPPPPRPTYTGEEVLDTLLLVARNGVQFWRLGTILNRSGHSLFNPPKPIDLSQAREGEMDLDLDLDDEEAYAGGTVSKGRMRGASAMREGYGRIVSGTEEPDEATPDLESGERRGVFGPGKGKVGYEAGRENLTERDEEQWDRLG